MNKIYYILYNVKILDHLLHVARPRKKSYYCISRINHGPAATQSDCRASVFFKQLASDANTLRVIWRRDRTSMDDTDESIQVENMGVFCTVTRNSF